MTETISTYPIELTLILSLVLGLVVGSFLNVVIYRLPLQLQNSWRHDAMDFLGQKPDADSKKFSLVYPPSRCPSCEVLIKPWHNIPVISYLLLKGRCKSCAEPISLQYPGRRVDLRPVNCGCGVPLWFYCTSGVGSAIYLGFGSPNWH